MGESVEQVNVVVWADARVAALAGEVLGRMGDVNVAAVGGPRRAQVIALAESFDARIEDDLRKMLVDHPGAFLLLGSAEGVGRAGLEQARKGGVRVLAIEPVPGSPGAEGGRPRAPGGEGGQRDRLIVTVPWMRMSAAWTAAAEPQQALGRVRSMSVAFLGPPGAGSLFARLHDAMDTLTHLMGAPATIDAALSGPLAHPPEDLASVTGHLTAHVRFAGDAAATLHVSDRAADWSRRLVAIGTEGQLTLDDAGYRLLNLDGRELDSFASPRRSPDPAGLIVEQWRRLLARPQAPEAADPAALLACCHAALLSCRTGELESPETLLHLRGA